ncbi:MAG: type II toxin-antitoxin system VapC family toxin [Acidobacteria bacterium]|nr:type II toxin-antitoxin system VapC family toxin [Acidobacteriota bacterium]
MIFGAAAEESPLNKRLKIYWFISIVKRNDFDQFFWKEVGKIKANNKASLADCIAVVLANQLGGTVLTSDHHEFDKIAQDRVCSIQFIR